jgi:hypothetical protein
MKGHMSQSAAQACDQEQKDSDRRRAAHERASPTPDASDREDHSERFYTLYE